MAEPVAILTTEGDALTALRVTRREWLRLPLERCYYRLEGDTPAFFEVLSREEASRG